MHLDTATGQCGKELQGTFENRSLLSGRLVFDILRKDDHLHTSEYSLQGISKGEVTNTTENGTNIANPIAKTI